MPLIPLMSKQEASLRCGGLFPWCTCANESDQPWANTNRLSFITVWQKHRAYAKSTKNISELQANPLQTSEGSSRALIQPIIQQESTQNNNTEMCYCQTLHSKSRMCDGFQGPRSLLNYQWPENECYRSEGWPHVCKLTKTLSLFFFSFFFTNRHWVKSWPGCNNALLVRWAVGWWEHE